MRPLRASSKDWHQGLAKILELRLRQGVENRQSRQVDGIGRIFRVDDHGRAGSCALACGNPNLTEELLGVVQVGVFLCGVAGGLASALLSPPRRLRSASALGQLAGSLGFVLLNALGLWLLRRRRSSFSFGLSLGSLLGLFSFGLGIFGVPGL